MNYLGDWGMQFGEYNLYKTSSSLVSLRPESSQCVNCVCCVGDFRLIGSWFWPIWVSGEIKAESLTALIWGEVLLNIVLLENALIDVILDSWHNSFCTGLCESESGSGAQWTDEAGSQRVLSTAGAAWPRGCVFMEAVERDHSERVPTCLQGSTWAQ